MRVARLAATNRDKSRRARRGGRKLAITMHESNALKCPEMQASSRDVKPFC